MLIICKYKFLFSDETDQIYLPQTLPNSLWVMAKSPVGPYHERYGGHAWRQKAQNGVETVNSEDETVLDREIERKKLYK